MTTDRSDQLPVHPVEAPDIFTDPDATMALIGPALDRLADVVVIDSSLLDHATPCAGFSVHELRNHVLAWLQFFAAALDDPTGRQPRIDPESWTLDEGDRPDEIVHSAKAIIDRAVRRGVDQDLVVMSGARMPGNGVLAMLLGEYLVHGWDLATATGQAWTPDHEAAGPALDFLKAMVAPEHRGPDSGFFDQEFVVGPNADPTEQLLGFGGRNPAWTPNAG